MKKIKEWFTEADGSPSWRKILTAEGGILFAYAVIGFEIKNHFAELPASYQAILAGIFAFYFIKKPLEKLWNK